MKSCTRDFAREAEVSEVLYKKYACERETKKDVF